MCPILLQFSLIVILVRMWILSLVVGFGLVVGGTYALWAKNSRIPQPGVGLGQ